MAKRKTIKAKDAKTPVVVEEMVTVNKRTVEGMWRAVAVCMRLDAEETEGVLKHILAGRDLRMPAKGHVDRLVLTARGVSGSEVSSAIGRMLNDPDKGVYGYHGGLTFKQVAKSVVG